MSAVGPSADNAVRAELGPHAFLSMDAVFGTHNIPDEDLPMITESKTPTRDGGERSEGQWRKTNYDKARICNFA